MEPMLLGCEAIEAAMTDSVELPAFGPTAVFFDVEGDPVSFDNGTALRWVGGKPEPMSTASAMRGAHISPERFKALVKAAS